MSTTPSSSQNSPHTAARLVEYERFIDQRIRKTRGAVKTMEFAASVLMLSIAALIYLMAMALVDHWLVPGGLGLAGRIVAFVIFVALATGFLARQLHPLVFHRVNPVYAAHTIEQANPTLKNGLINFLLLRGRRAEVPRGVYQAMEAQAATRLANVEEEGVVDHSRLIQMAYVLCAVLIVCGLYKVLSPKDPLVTAGRVLAPWSDLRAPTRVTIDDVRPGEASVPQGDQVRVSARVRGLDEDESVNVWIASDGLDGDERRIEMFVPPGDNRHACRIPETAGGVRHAFRYRLVAGDAVSPTFRVRVTAVPTMVVESVEYQYPAYTQMTARVVPRQGDIRAIEGTSVTVNARANYAIQSARIDFESDGRSDRPMTFDGDRASVRFSLGLKQDRRTPQPSSYRLTFANEQGHGNRQPIEHRVEVMADLPPEATILAPEQDEVDLPLDGSAVIEVRAVDPDFALRSVTLHGTPSGDGAMEQRLLDEERAGQFSAKFDFAPATHGYRPGDVVQVWATATDNKQPDPQTGQSSRKQFRIVGPEKESAAQRSEDRAAETDGDKTQDAESGDTEQRDSEQAADTEPGEAGPSAEDQPPERPPSENGESAEDQSADGQRSEAQQRGPQEAQQDEGRGQRQDESAGEQDSEPRAGDPDADGGQQDDASASQKGTPSQGTSEKPAPGSKGSGAESDDSGQPGQRQGQRASGDEADQTQRSGGQQQSSSRESSRDGAAGDAQDGSPQPAAGEPGSSPEESASRDRQEVARDGSDDGSAFRKLLKQFQDQRGEQRGGGQPGAQQQNGDPDAAGAEPTPSEGQAPQRDAAADGGRDTQDAQDRQSATQRGGRRSTGQEPGRTGDDRSAADGSGANQGQDADRDGRSPGEPQDKQTTDRQTAEQEATGQPGAGQGDADAESPDPQDTIKPREKSPAASPEDAEQQEAKSPAHGRTESDSSGAKAGDRPGGGESGGGQQADRQGTGSAGSHTDADQGSGASEQPGPGQTTDQAGDDSPAAEGGGASDAAQPGGGSRTRAGPRGKDAQEGGSPRPETPAGDRQSRDGTGARAGGPESGAGTPNEDERRGQEPPQDPGPSKPDKVNLEYARKATELVLEKLKDQMAQDKVDEHTLDDLGWSREDLQRFVRRWDQMKQRARMSGDTGRKAREELDEALRSLGLRKDRLEQRYRPDDDRLKKLNEAFRQPPPMEIESRLRAYNRGVSRSAPSPPASRP